MATFEPTHAVGPATKEGFARYSRFAEEYIMDRPPVELFSFQNFNEHDPDATEGMGAGAPEFAEVSTSSIGGVLVATSADAYGHLLVLPYWIDPAARIDFCGLWSNSQSAGTGTFTLAVTYTPVDVSTQSTATAIAATALDSTIDAQADLAANVARWTEWGYISANKTGVKDLDPGRDFLCLEFVGTLGTITDASVLAAQYRGYRKYL